MAFRAAPLSSGRIVPRVTIGRVTPLIPPERPNANTLYCQLFKATTAYTSACTGAGAALALLLSGVTRVRHWQSPRRLWPDTRRLQLPLDDCCRLLFPYNAVHSIQQTEQIPNDPPRMGAKSTTTSSHPCTPEFLKPFPELFMIHKGHINIIMIIESTFAIWISCQSNPGICVLRRKLSRTDRRPVLLSLFCLKFVSYLNKARNMCNTSFSRDFV